MPGQEESAPVTPAAPVPARCIAPKRTGVFSSRSRTTSTACVQHGTSAIWPAIARSLDSRKHGSAVLPLSWRVISLWFVSWFGWDISRFWPGRRRRRRLPCDVLAAPDALPLQVALPQLFPFAEMSLAVDGLSAFFLLVVALVTAAAAIYGPSYLGTHAQGAAGADGGPRRVRRLHGARVLRGRRAHLPAGLGGHDARELRPRGERHARARRTRARVCSTW